MLASPYVVTRAAVASTARLSPSFMRLELASEQFAEFGVDGPWYDQRIKLVFPGATGVLPPTTAPHDDWFGFWHDLPDDRRGFMRTYSVRDVCGTGPDTRIVVDFVMHLDPGSTGPASRWASDASVGDELILVGPRKGHDVGGIEFRPGRATEVLLVADETAVPAACRILEDVPQDLRVTAFFEVPHQSDTLPMRGLGRVDLTWIAREDRPHGERLLNTVLEHLGDRSAVAEPTGPLGEELIWETPDLSAADQADADVQPDFYAWIAGESAMVTSLRRHLVRDSGVDRHRVAFMGYWRHGVAMRS